MKKEAVLCLLISVPFLLSFVGIGVCVPANGSINVPYSTDAPIIDGGWSTTFEWNDASENKITNENGTSYLRLKNNETHIFVLLDFISDQSDSLEDLAVFAFDTNDEGGSVVKPDDYQFSYYYALYFAPYSGTAAQGTGLTPSSWTGIAQPEGFTMQRGFTSNNDPYESSAAHSVYEAAIPRSILSQNSNMGFYAYLNDSKTGIELQFPAEANGNSPGEWADIIIEAPAVSPSPSPTPSNSPTPTETPIQSPSSTPSTPSPTIPELTTVTALVIAISTAIVAALVLRRKKEQKP